MHVTMKQIAQRVGVSVNAVSLALNNRAGISQQTRRRILIAADEMGYIPRNERFDKSFSSMNICVMMKKEYYAVGNSNFYPRVLYGVQKAAKANGYDIMLSIIGAAQEIPKFLEKKRVCGIIVLGTIDEDYLARVNVLGIPIVLVDHASSRFAFDCVITDNRFGTFESVNFLLAAGYRRIGFFGDFSYSNSNRERFLGYQEALMRHGDADYEKTLADVARYSILDNIEPLISARNTEAIAHILQQRETLPEAFQCSNDTAAVMLCNVLRLLHYKVPEQVGVVGFDDKDIATMLLPKLTTLHVANDRMGQKAVQKLLWRLANPKAPPEKVMMAVELVVRESTRLPQGYRQACDAACPQPMRAEPGAAAHAGI